MPIRDDLNLADVLQLMCLAGFLGWTWDAFDFFTVSLMITETAKDFEVGELGSVLGI